MEKKRKYEFKKDKRWKKVRYITAGAIALVLVFGLAYALFTQILQGTKKVSIDTGNLSLAITNESPASGINITDAVPETAQYALQNEPAYAYDLENNGTISANYTMYLKVPMSNTLLSDYVDMNIEKSSQRIFPETVEEGLASYSIGNLRMPLPTSTDPSDPVEPDDPEGTGIASYNKKYSVQRLGVSGGYFGPGARSDYDEMIVLNDYTYALLLRGSKTVYDLDSGEPVATQNTITEGTTFYYGDAREVYVYDEENDVGENVAYYHVLYLNAQGNLVDGYIADTNDTQALNLVTVYEDSEDGWCALLKIDEGTIAKNESIHYAITSWVDEHAPNAAKAKHFEASILVHATQAIH